jgi:hypothetical protein
MMRWNLIILMLLGVSASAWGLTGARLIGLSTSGSTALFNLGLHDGVKEGDFAVIVKEIRSLETSDLRIVPVAKAKNIKITTNSSVWILYKMYDANLLTKGEKFLVLSETHLLSGRRDPRLGRISVATEKDKIASETMATLSDDKDRLSKLKVLYPEVQTLHEKESRSDNDFDLIDVEGWRKMGQDRHRTALYKSPHQMDFRRELRLSTFEKLVTAYLQRVNDPGFNYDKFYDEQKKTVFANEFREKTNFNTEYEEYLSLQARKAVENAKLYRSLLEKGESWSEDFSDEELKVVLGKVSVLQEKDRRTFVVSDPKKYTLFIGYGMTVNDAQTDKDADYRREGPYSVDLDFEGIPVIKHETLERFTLNASVRTNKTAFEAQNKNASVDELSVSAGMNWYPLYAPHAHEAPAIFIGAYIRSGTAAAEAPAAQEKSNYTLLAMPGFRGGMKYNFKNNVGLRFAFSMETLKLDRYEQSKFGSILPDQADIVEAKMNFALAYSF